MSRHQAYRNYDYENDLDEYDGGGDDYEEEGEALSAEDKGMLKPQTWFLLRSTETRQWMIS